ncbi:MAG: hypothetical protein OXR82_10180 [Gammaproteobacteria bacterium]|nr:hypothetical protein [Gammaproteobacteria bacterium]
MHTTTDKRLLFELDDDKREPYDVPKLTLWKRSRTKRGLGHTLYAYIPLDEFADKLDAGELEAITFPCPPTGPPPIRLARPLNYRESGRTPGPWRLDFSNRAGKCAEIYFGEQHLGWMVHEEDAILAAAAPRMLEALEECRSILEFHARGRSPDAPERKAFDKADAAIAKAKGEA